jgi:hypothetical protein
LLVEAGLAAVVIALGLVFVSRGLSNQLAALRIVDEREALLALAQGQLAGLEAQRLAGIPPEVSGRSGTLDDAYEWSLTAAPREDLGMDAESRPLFSEVTLTVRRARAAVSLTAIWPASWLSP